MQSPTISTLSSKYSYFLRIFFRCEIKVMKNTIYAMRIIQAKMVLRIMVAEDYVILRS